MKSGLYHKDVYMPKLNVKGKINVTPSRHAQERNLNLPRVIDLEKVEIVEIEVRWGKIVKALVRMPYDRKNHLVMAIALPDCIIKTAWKNTWDDDHSTLDVSRYNVR